MKTFKSFIAENTGRNVYLLFKQELKDKFKKDHNVTLNQKGNEYHITSDIGSFNLIPVGKTYKLGKYNFEGHDKWFLSVIKDILKFEQIRNS